MTDESTKTRRVRGPDFERRYLQGRVIDIGCGPDPIVPHAEPFDLDQGDAERVGELRPHDAYDAVCSSHCLEHMRDVPRALTGWWSLVKPGGVLVLVVPEENLYEQGGWPSLFNTDHKATFRIGSASSWSPVSYDIRKLVETLPNVRIVSCEVMDQGYDPALKKNGIGRYGRFMFRARMRLGQFFREHPGVGALANPVDRLLTALGTPVDQTSGPALAQIQVIARKAEGQELRR